MSFSSRLSFNRPYSVDIVLLVLVFITTGVFTLSIISEPMLETAGEWTNLHQSLFQATLIFAYLSVFMKNHYRSLWVAIVIGYFLQKHLVFDEIVHLFFIDSGIYKLIGHPAFSGNPQYGKLLLFCPALLLQIANIIRASKDRVRIFLNFLYIVVTVLVAFLNHFLYPSGIMRDLMHSRIEQLSHIEVFDKAAFRSLCIQINARCRVSDQSGIQLLNDPDFDFDDEQYQSLENFSQQLAMNQNITTLETNNLQGIYIVKEKANHSFYEIFDHDYVRLVWSSMLGNFSRNSFFITWLWQMFLFAVLFVHSTPRLTL